MSLFLWVFGTLYVGVALGLFIALEAILRLGNLQIQWKSGRDATGGEMHFAIVFVSLLWPVAIKRAVFTGARRDAWTRLRVWWCWLTTRHTMGKWEPGAFGSQWRHCRCYSRFEGKDEHLIYAGLDEIMRKYRPFRP